MIIICFSYVFVKGECYEYFSEHTGRVTRKSKGLSKRQPSYNPKQCCLGTDPKRPRVRGKAF
jgi:hypothetical protein